MPRRTASGSTSYDRGLSDRSPSVDRTVPRKRPPLRHAACVDHDSVDLFPDVGSRSAVQFQFRSRSASLERRPRLDDTPETPSFTRSEESDDRRSGVSSFDFDANLYPDVFVKKDADGMDAKKKRNVKRPFDDRPFCSAGADVNDPLQIQRMSVTALFEKFCADEREVNRRPQPIRQASETCFRTNRLRGVSTDRLGGMFTKKARNDRMSTSSLGDQPASGSCLSIQLDKRKGRLGRLDRSKRLSASALYDRSPTSRSTEERLFKNCSEDLDRNAPSTSTSDNFVSLSRFRFDENPLERAGVTRLYEKFCNGDGPSSAETSQSTPGHGLGEPETVPKPEPFSAASLGEHTSDIMSSTIRTDADDVFDSDALGDVDPDRSDSVSNTVQLVFEDPRSNRTSVSDIYEPCFSVSLCPRQPSFKRDSLKGNWMDDLEFRPIDDESPTARFASPNGEVDSDLFVFNVYNGDALPTLADIHEGDSTEENSFSDSSPSYPKPRLVPSRSMSSRSSMQKLQPIALNRPVPFETPAAETIPLEKLTLEDKPKKPFRSRKAKYEDPTASPVKRTRCFPL